jgi:hypothetical protein
MLDTKPNCEFLRKRMLSKQAKMEAPALPMVVFCSKLSVLPIKTQ